MINWRCYCVKCAYRGQ